MRSNAFLGCKTLFGKVVPFYRSAFFVVVVILIVAVLVELVYLFYGVVQVRLVVFVFIVEVMVALVYLFHGVVRFRLDFV